MKEAVRKLFGIYPGEERNALSFALLGFIWAVAVSLGWKNADAFFILNVGAASLPTAYTIIAGCMIVIASIMMWAYDRFSVHTIFLTNLSIGICFYIAAHFALKHGMESKAIWYALRIFGWIFFCVINTNFWTFIDQYYHLSDAKRLFSLFTSSVFLGFGTTGLLMQNGLPEFEIVALFIVAILFGACGLIYWIIKTIRPIHSDYDINPAHPSQDSSWKQMLAEIFSSKFTLCLMALNFSIYVSLVLTEINYMTAFQNYFGGGFSAPVANEESAPLTLFLGKCITAASLFNIIFGLFIYSRLVQRLGLRNMLVFTPLLIITTYFGWQFSAALIFPLMGFFIVESSFLVVDDNNFNLLLNGVPTKLKYKVRVFIESFLEPIGTLTSALLVSFFTINSTLLALFVGCIMFCIALMVRYLYPKAIYQNLVANVIHFEKNPEEWLDNLSEKERKGAKNRLLTLFQNDDETAKEFAIEGILKFSDQNLFDRFLDLLKESPANVKLLFLQKLPGTFVDRDPDLLEEIQQWNTEDCPDTLKGSLHLFLAKNGLLSSTQALKDLNNSDPKLTCAGLIALKHSSDFQDAVAVTELRALALLNLKRLLESENDSDLLMGLEVLAYGATKEDIHILCPYLESPSIEIAKSAARTIAQVATPDEVQYGPFLLHHLTTKSDVELRKALLAALGKIADPDLIEAILIASDHLRPAERRQIERSVVEIGSSALPVLLKVTKNTTLHDRSRVLAGRILGRLDLQKLRFELFDICKKEIDRAYFYFYHLCTIEKNHPERDLHVLKDALLSSYHSVTDFIIQLLGVAGEIEDVELLSLSMRSSNPKVRAQVVETLRRTCETPLFRLLQPLLDELPISEKLKSAAKHQASLSDILDTLKESPLVVDQIAAAAVIAAFPDSKRPSIPQSG